MVKKKSRNLLRHKINLATSQDKNNHETSQDKKIMQPLGEKKIMQPLETIKNHATSRDITNHTTSRNKTNYATFLDKKKPYNLLGQKNYTTSQDKNKSRNLSGKKNQATFWDKKIMQPLGTKKSHNLSGPKKIMQPLRTKNHATSRDKKNNATSRDKNKIMQPLSIFVRTFWVCHSLPWSSSDIISQWYALHRGLCPEYIVICSGHGTLPSLYCDMLWTGNPTKSIFWKTPGRGLTQNIWKQGQGNQCLLDLNFKVNQSPWISKKNQEKKNYKGKPRKFLKNRN